MKHIKIRFADIPLSSFGPENNWIINTLRERYEVEISDKPDFLFYSVFGHEYLNYDNCVKIFFTGEISVPNFNECDYAFSFAHLSFGNRHMRAIIGDPVADTITNIRPNIQDKSLVTDQMVQRRFCNFVYSQDTLGKGAVLRKDFCLDLMKYKHVDCPGLVLNNMPKDSIAPRWQSSEYSSGNVDTGWNQGKLDFLRNYKFTIAFENLYVDGYTTEKLIHPFMANSVPIYWGNPLVTKDFNPKAFINCNDYDSFDDVIQRIKELDNDEEQYLEMLRQPPVQESYDFNSEQKVQERLFEIIERGSTPFAKDEFSKDVVNQLRNDVITAWNIIAELKATQSEKVLENMQSQSVQKMMTEMEASTTLRIVKVSQKFFNTKFGKAVKKVLKPILKACIKLHDRRK